MYLPLSPCVCRRTSPPTPPRLPAPAALINRKAPFSTSRGPRTQKCLALLARRCARWSTRAASPGRTLSAWASCSSASCPSGPRTRTSSARVRGCSTLLICSPPCVVVCLARLLISIGRLSSVHQAAASLLCRCQAAPRGCQEGVSLRPDDNSQPHHHPPPCIMTLLLH